MDLKALHCSVRAGGVRDFEDVEESATGISRLQVSLVVIITLIDYMFLYYREREK